MGALTIKPYAYEYRSWEFSKKLMTNLVSIYPEYVYLQFKDNNPFRVIASTNTDFISNLLRFSMFRYKNKCNALPNNLFNFGFLMDIKPTTLKNTSIKFTHFLNMYNGINIPLKELHYNMSVLINKNLIKKYIELVYYTNSTTTEFSNIFLILYLFVLYKFPIVLTYGIHCLPFLFVSNVCVTTLLHCWESNCPTYYINVYNKKYIN